MKHLVSKTLFCGLIILLLAPITFAQEKVTIVNFEIYKNNTINSLRLYIDIGSESLELSNEVKEYRIEVLGENNEVLYKKYFDVIFESHIDPPEEGEGKFFITNKRALTFKLKSFLSQKSLRIYHDSKLLFDQEIQLCNNNNICEHNPNENYLSCPSDCPGGSADEFCDGLADNTCDNDCVTQGRTEKDIDCTCGNNICDGRENSDNCSRDCKISSNKKSNLTYLIGVLIILAVIGIYLFKRQKQ